MRRHPNHHRFFAKKVPISCPCTSLEPKFQTKQKAPGYAVFSGSQINFSRTCWTLECWRHLNTDKTWWLPPEFVDPFKRGCLILQALSLVSMLFFRAVILKKEQVHQAQCPGSKKNTVTNINTTYSPLSYIII